MRKFLPLFVLLTFFVFVFKPFFWEGKLPIPADTIVGLYHPWRDAYADQYPSGIPFKNFLTTDPVRQQYVWRELAMENLKSGIMPQWNPYSLAGTPLLANIQAAVFYPLNLIYFVLPFSLGWSFQIMLQTILGGIFMCLYLRSLKLRPEAQALGVLSWVGSGFFVGWFEWNTLVQVAIWLPLILLSIDKLTSQKLSVRAMFTWSGVFVFSLASSFLAGHLQIFFYVFLFTAAYVIRAIAKERKFSLVKYFLLSYFLFFILTSIQWLPMITLFQESVRSVSSVDWQKPEWFLPWQNLAQFIAPDFLGNPATLNYFGIWNYGEFVGYVGLVPLFFALFAVSRKHSFWIGVIVLSLLFMLRNPISELLFKTAIPLISFAQPTRLIVLVDFALAMLVAFGTNYFLSAKKNRVWATSLFLAIPLIAFWVISWKMNLSVSQKNLIFPTVLLLSALVVLKIPKGSIVILVFLSIFDLGRFVSKFESFSSPELLFPRTKIVNFLQEKSKIETFRVMALDDRVFPPNFSTHYKIQMISGYDSLYLKNYVQLVGGLSRILTPKNPNTQYFPLLNAKYLLSLEDLNNKNFQLVFKEGMTRVYENKNVLPRTFFKDQTGQAGVEKYLENEIIVKTKNVNDGELVLLDAYYPSWKADIDGQPAKIFSTDVAFRTIFVPRGEHKVRFSI